MRVKQDRLLNSLKEHRFCAGIRTYAKDSFTFVRPASVEELFESIIVDSQGKHGEAVYASVGVAVTRSVAYKLLGEVRLLDELAEDTERGWTIIDNDEKAKEWEAELVRIAPAKAAEWSALKAQSILETTKEARVATRRYLELLEPTADLDLLLQALQESVPRDVLEEAREMYSGGVTGTEIAHEIACIAVLEYSARVEHGNSFRGKSPLADCSLMQRIKILADRLLPKRSEP